MNRLLHILSIALLALLLTGFGIHFLRKFNDLRRLRSQQMEYEQRIVELESRIAQLSREIELIQSDPDRLERLAREKLGLIGKNERVYIIEPVAPLPVPGE